MALVSAELSNAPLALGEAWDELDTPPKDLSERELLWAGVRPEPIGRLCVNFWDLQPGDVLLSGHFPDLFGTGTTETSIFAAQRALRHPEAACAWHHVAMFLGEGLVVESRMDGGVQLVTMSHFLNRNRAARIAVRRHVGLSQAHGASAVAPRDVRRLERAMTVMVGAAYRSFSDLLRLVRSEFSARDRQPLTAQVTALQEPAICSEVAYKGLTVLVREQPFEIRRIPCPAHFARVDELVDVPLAWHRLA